MIIHDLPDAGQHNTGTVQIGPDDMMYISIGSTYNECAGPNPENATTRSIFASGLRDTVGWSWQPQTGERWIRVSTHWAMICSRRYSDRVARRTRGAGIQRISTAER